MRRETIQDKVAELEDLAESTADYTAHAKLSVSDSTRALVGIDCQYDASPARQVYQ